MYANNEIWKPPNNDISFKKWLKKHNFVVKNHKKVVPIRKIRKQTKRNIILSHSQEFYNNPQSNIFYSLEACLMYNKDPQKYRNGIHMPMTVTITTNNDMYGKHPTLFYPKLKSDAHAFTHALLNIDVAAKQRLDHQNAFFLDTRNFDIKKNNNKIKAYIFDMNYNQPIYIRRNLHYYLKQVQEAWNQKYSNNTIEFVEQEDYETKQNFAVKLITGREAGLPGGIWNIHSSFHVRAHGICGSVAKLITMIWTRYNSYFKEFPELIAFIANLLTDMRKLKGRKKKATPDQIKMIDSMALPKQKLWDKFVEVNLRSIKFAGELKFVPAVVEYYKLEKLKNLTSYINSLPKIEENIQKEIKIERLSHKKKNPSKITSVGKLILSTDPIEIKSGGGKKTKKVRKHQGINQTGGNKGRLKKGYKYSGKKLKSGLPQIIKCKSKKC